MKMQNRLHLKNVRHRLDDLEIPLFDIQSDNIVRHRLDDLETLPHNNDTPFKVRHRLDDLEIKCGQRREEG